MEEPEIDLQTQALLLASAKHDIPALRNLLKEGDVNVQDTETGYTPLHAAIAACELDEDELQPKISEATNTNGNVNGHGSTEEPGPANPDREEELQMATETVKYLLQAGAIWNDLDTNGETPGCMARRLGLTELYEVMVDAGVRAELLLNRLDQYEPLAGDDSDDEQSDSESKPAEAEGEAAADVATAREGDQEQETSAIRNPDVASEQYLQSGLTLDDNKLLDEDQNGVMMAWETEIMKRSTEILQPSPGLRVLNIGHGMAIIDNFIQEKSPSSHHIVEAHPDVLANMRKEGWFDKSGVTVHEGKWQDVLPKLLEDNTIFDAIYFDTFAESYSNFREFFSENVIGLLDPGGIWGFFNGLGADRQISYDVYTKVVEMDLFEAGFDVEWETIEVPKMEGEWQGVRRRYFVAEKYRLPVCIFME